MFTFEAHAHIAFWFGFLDLALSLRKHDRVLFKQFMLQGAESCNFIAQIPD